jgi:hypothetical protein
MNGGGKFAAAISLSDVLHFANCQAGAEPSTV